MNSKQTTPCLRFAKMLSKFRRKVKSLTEEPRAHWQGCHIFPGEREITKLRKVNGTSISLPFRFLAGSSRQIVLSFKRYQYFLLISCEALFTFWKTGAGEFNFKYGLKLLWRLRRCAKIKWCSQTRNSWKCSKMSLDKRAHWCDFG